MIYFDSNATTIPSEEVLKVYEKITKEVWFNPSSMHKAGVLSKSYIDKATSKICETLGLVNKSIIYTSGATEANNLAIYGVCNNYLNENKHIITTMIEHPSVYNPYKHLESIGFKVTYLRCRNGVIDLDELKASLTKDTILVSLMWVNNIIGSIQPLKKAIEIIKLNSHAKIHVDAVQGIGKIPFDFNPNLVDFLVFTSHKIEGLKGTGALVINENTQLASLIKGGHQQQNTRAGTMDTAGIVSFSKALTLSYSSLNEHYYYVQSLCDYLLENLKTIKNITINRTDALFSPYVVNISFSNIKGETVMHHLEQANIFVGVGSACNEKTKTLERAIMELSDDESRAVNMVRISLSHLNKKEEIDILIKELKKLERI